MHSDEAAGSTGSHDSILIVVPCYNEAERLDVATFLAFASKNEKVGFVMVDDGSTDGTLRLLRELKDQASDQFQVIAIPRNVGKAEAVRRGVLVAFRAAPGYVGFWDADLATPLPMIIEFAHVLNNRPALMLVTGARVLMLGRDINRRASRHYFGRVFATAASLVLKAPVYDTQCGAKLFRAHELVCRLFDLPFSSRWLFDVEILARLANVGGIYTPSRLQQLVYELPLPRWSDVAGSKVQWRDAVRAAFDLAVIFRRYKHR